MPEAKKTILIADDQQDARIIVETIVSEIGDFDIVTATSGEHAYQKIARKVPDLLILDVMMPGMDGFTLFRDLRADERTAEIPIIMCTGVSSELGITFTKQGMGEYLGKPPVAFLDKPVDPDLLKDAVVKALGL